MIPHTQLTINYLFYAILVFEGEDISFASKITEEIEEKFGVGVIILIYNDNIDPKVMNISLWWYDPLSEILNLRRRWDKYYDRKLLYASGKKEIDMDDYCSLVEKTWRYLSNVNFQINYYTNKQKPVVEIDKTDVLSFYDYIKMMERLIFYSVRPEKDQSKNYIYTVTAMIADELARLGCGKAFGTPVYNFYGDFIGIGGNNMDVTLAAPYPESDKRVHYSITEKNYHVLFEAAKRLNEGKSE